MRQKKGWGATCNSKQTQGLWSPAEQLLHINVLELKAVTFAVQAFAVQAFAKEISNLNVHVPVKNLSSQLAHSKLT